MNVLSIQHSKDAEVSGRLAALKRPLFSVTACFYDLSPDPRAFDYDLRTLHWIRLLEAPPNVMVYVLDKDDIEQISANVRQRTVAKYASRDDAVLFVLEPPLGDAGASREAADLIETQIAAAHPKSFFIRDFEAGKHAETFLGDLFQMVDSGMFGRYKYAEPRPGQWILNIFTASKRAGGRRGQ